MSRKRKLAQIGAIIFLSLGLALAVTTAYLAFIPKKPKSQPQITETKIFPIVRLHDVRSGRFFCSGTVISDKYVLTAAHCVASQSIFSSGPDLIEIRSASGVEMGLFAEIAGANPRQDVAILQGDFRAFDKMQIETDPNAIDASFTKSSRIVACGYPAGGKLNCNQVNFARFYEFFYQGIAHLYPGQSGGPVIDMETGRIIAVNTAVHENTVILAPLAELFAQLDLDETL